MSNSFTLRVEFFGDMPAALQPFMDTAMMMHPERPPLRFGKPGTPPANLLGDVFILEALNVHNESPFGQILDRQRDNPRTYGRLADFQGPSFHVEISFRVFDNSPEMRGYILDNQDGLAGMRKEASLRDWEARLNAMASSIATAAHLHERRRRNAANPRVPLSRRTELRRQIQPEWDDVVDIWLNNGRPKAVRR